jgi:group I intron endonuclease
LYVESLQNEIEKIRETLNVLYTPIGVGGSTIICVAVFFMIGIYKITSPTKRVYIGQSINIEKRWKAYKANDFKHQPKLRHSFKKHGYGKHNFQILCECNVEELNEMERYYQDLYSCTNRSGLNCRLTISSDKKGVISEETRKNISNARKLFIKNNPNYYKWKPGRPSKNKGIPRSEETKIKISQTMTGRVFSEDHRQKINKSNTGKKRGSYKRKE